MSCCRSIDLKPLPLFNPCMIDSSWSFTATSLQQTKLPEQKTWDSRWIKKQPTIVGHDFFQLLLSVVDIDY